jgi:hypothetical protein
MMTITAPNSRKVKPPLRRRRFGELPLLNHVRGLDAGDDPGRPAERLTA